MVPDAVRSRRQGAVAVVEIDYPPVNALSNAVRAALIETVRRLDADPEVTALVIAGTGGRFIAGADIREMSQPPAEPFLPELVAAIEALSKPVVAAIDGPALGGGLEIALACDLRIGSTRARLGLPETRLGLIPGAGGTQRLPRLVGLAEAIAMIGEARVLGAVQALAAGLLDRICDGSVVDEAVAVAPGLPKRLVSALSVVDDGRDVAAAVAAARRRGRGIEAVAEAVRVVQAAGTLSFAEGLALERETFLRLRAGEEAAALRHLFLAEREAGKGLDTPRPLRRAAVIGGGTMGSGIAVCLADAGLDVALIERDAEAAEAGATRVRALYAKQSESGRLTAQEADRRLGRISAGDDWSRLSDVDVVIEAAFEDLDVKADIFRKIDAHAHPDAILASNTSYLDLDVIAGFTERPAEVLGLHFFSPAHVMRLLEVVRGRQTSPEVLATGVALAKRLGKVAIVASVGDGFIGNRIFAHYRSHAEYLLEDGASPLEIDRALEQYGFAMGPFAVADLSGLDIAWAMRRRRAAARDPAERYVNIPDLFCEAGRLGRKTGAGWYSYASGKPELDPAAVTLIAAGRERAGAAGQSFDADQIRRRLLAVMVNEAAKVLEDGVASRASDIDLAFVNGYGFPRGKGGPMFAADRIGLQSVLAEVEAAARSGGAGSEPSELLVRLAREGRSFF